MGISSPAIGYSGFIASDVVIWTDPTVYVASSTSSVEILWGSIIEDIAANSKLRFKATLKDDNNNAGTTYCYLRINGSTIATVSESGAAYVTDEDDFDFTYKRGDLVAIAVKKSFAGTGSIKDISITGSRSPIIIN